MQLDGARVVLTGATGGIGRALAQAFRRAGAGLLLTGRSQGGLAAVAASLPAGKAPVRTVVADLLAPGGIEILRAAADDFPGGVDVLVNNAGRNEPGLFEQLSDADLGAIVELDLLVPMRLSHALLPQLAARPRSAIVNIGSVFGSIGFPGNVAYSASKFGLRGFSEALRRELADSPVRVCYVAPRVVATEFNPPNVQAMNRALGNRQDSPDAVSAAVLRAIRSGAAATVIGRPEGLFTRVNALVPRVVDGAIRRKLPLIKRHLRD